MPERILITGAAGGVGTLLRPRLAAPDRVLRLLDVAEVPPGDGVEVLRASITDLAAMEAACEGVSAVIHLGGHSLERPWPDVLDVNINGTYSVLEAARRQGVPRVVLASSNHAVGFHPRAEGEAGDYLFPRPDSFYGVSKVALEALGSLYADRYGLDVVCVRIGSCFERPRDARMLATWLSPDDAARLFEACLATPSPGFRVVWGVSDNTRRWFSLTEARALGYEPRDDAETHAADLVADPDSLAERHVGGVWCGPEFNTAIQEAGR